MNDSTATRLCYMSFLFDTEGKTSSLKGGILLDTQQNQNTSSNKERKVTVVRFDPIPRKSHQQEPQKKVAVVKFDPRRCKNVPKEMQLTEVPTVCYSEEMNKHTVALTADENEPASDVERCKVVHPEDVEMKPMCQFAPLLRATAAYGMMFSVESNPYPYQTYTTPQWFRPIGEGYLEGCNGYYHYTQSKKLIRFTTFRLEILAEIHQLHLHEGSTSTIYRIRIFGVGAKQATLEIPMEKWDSLEDKIKKLYPAWSICKDATFKASELFKRLTGLLLETSNFPILIGSADWGWGIEDSSKNRLFYHGGLPDCSCKKTLLEQLPPEGKTVWLSKAWSVLDVGDASITIPMLTYGACAYLDAIFGDADYPLDFALMAMGETGFMKTAFCRVLYNVFEERKKQIHSIRGTAAAMTVLHQEAFDDVLVVDDFNLEGSQQEVKEKTKNFQALIRAYSDKTPREKYAGNHQVTSYAIRGGLVITGETEVTGQIKSSELRYLRVIFTERLKGDRLQVFQDTPEIMKHFWSEYIYYLERNYRNLVQYFKDSFPSKRGLLASVKEPRLRDDYAHLVLAWETLMGFLSQAGVIRSEDQSKWTILAAQQFAELVHHQCAEAQKEDPYVRYIKEFWNLIGTGKVAIARNLEIYVGNLGSYLGYEEREKGVYWLKSDELFKCIRNACIDRGENLPLSPKEILRQLKEHDLTLCNQGSTLMKASSKIPGRPRMVVLKIAACESIINQK